MLSIYSMEDLQFLGGFGKNIQVDKSVIFISPQNIYLGDNVRIDAFCMLSGSQGIEIGSQVHIAPYCQLAAAGGKITMQDFSGLSSRVSIFTASDDYVGGSLTNPMTPNQLKKLKLGPVILEKHVIIGCGTVIMPNITCQFGSSVGALSFVNRNVLSGNVVSGQPAKIISTRNLEKLKENEAEYYKYTSDLI